MRLAITRLKTILNFWMSKDRFNLVELPGPVDWTARVMSPSKPVIRSRGTERAQVSIDRKMFDVLIAGNAEKRLVKKTSRSLICSLRCPGCLSCSYASSVFPLPGPVSQKLHMGLLMVQIDRRGISSPQALCGGDAWPRLEILSPTLGSIA